MPRDSLDFARPRRASRGSVWPLIIAGVLLVALAGFAWFLLRASPPSGIVVEVRGEVPQPGLHRIDPPTLRQALLQAGLRDATAAAAPLHEGDLIRVTPSGLSISPAGNPLLFALPVDLNQADAEALGAVPGLGRERVAAILADRALRGPFYAVSDLGRVNGIGPATVTEIAPLLTVGDVGPRPPPQRVDLNTAPAWKLETLPGIGPVLAARIVVDRAERGPYESVEGLKRVDGVGPALIRGLDGRAVAQAAGPSEDGG